MKAETTGPFAREYARVFDRLAAEEREAVRSYFRMLGASTELAAGMKSFLDHPAIPDAEKMRSLESIAPRRFSPVVNRVLGDIVERRMTFLFSEIAEEMQRLSDEAANIHSVVVTSATELAESRRKTFTDRLKAYLGGAVKVRFSVDRMLVAGFRIQIGGTVIDNSLMTELEHIRRKLQAVSST